MNGAAPRLARYVAVIVAAGFGVMVMIAGGAAVWWATPINQPPVARSAERATQAGQAIEIDLGSLVSDADRDPLELAAELPPGTPGHLDVEGARARYEPGPSFAALARGESRAVRILYRASDGQNHPAHAAILVRVVGTLAPNQPPVAAADGAWTRAGERIIIDVLANDADPDPIDPAYLQGVQTAALVRAAIDAYEVGRYEEALDLYTQASDTVAGDQLRVHNGLYLVNWQLGRRDQAAEAFSRLVDYGLSNDRLAIRFLFKPGTATFWPPELARP